MQPRVCSSGDGKWNAIGDGCSVGIACSAFATALSDLTSVVSDVTAADFRSNSRFRQLWNRLKECGKITLHLQ